MKSILRSILKWYCRNFKFRGRHRLANKLGLRIMPKGGRDAIQIGRINLPIDHNIPMYRYVYYSIYEEEFVDFLKKTIKKGDTVIDPGTNVGYISAILSDLVGEHGRVFSIEPSRQCFNLIKTYLVAPNITLLNSALYNENVTKRFVDKANVVSSGYSAFNEYTGQLEGDDSYDIETITLKTLYDRYSISHIKFLKLDIEGAELAALIGCGNLLADHKIDYILVETNFIASHEKNNAAIINLFGQHGYKPHLPKSKGLVPVNLDQLKGQRLDIIWSHL